MKTDKKSQLSDNDTIPSYFSYVVSYVESLIR